MKRRGMSARNTISDWQLDVSSYCSQGKKERLTKMRSMLQDRELVGASSKALDRNRSLSSRLRSLSAAVALVLFLVAAAHAAASSPVLKEDVPVAAVLDLEAEPPTVAFQVNVPKDAVLMTLKISRTSAMLDVLAQGGIDYGAGRRRARLECRHAQSVGGFAAERAAAGAGALSYRGNGTGIRPAHRP